jgi:hypothetical protein
MGLEEEALKSSGGRFKDVPDWGRPYAEYAYRIGLTAGVDEEGTLFAPDRIVTLQEFTTFLMRVLGYYEKSGDFSFEGALAKAVEVGLYTDKEAASLGSAEDGCSRSGAVVSMSLALVAKSKGSNEMLIDSLVEKNVVTDDGKAAFLGVLSTAAGRK